MTRHLWAAFSLAVALLWHPAYGPLAASESAAPPAASEAGDAKTPQKTVTIRASDEPLSEVVRRLSQQAGVPIRVADRADTVIPHLDVQGSLEKVVAVVARFARLEVRKEGDGYVLAAPASPPAPDARGPSQPSAADVIAQVKPCVALVVAYIAAERARSQGTGFAVGPDGLVVTNAHVVAGAAAIQVAFPDGQPYYAAVAAIDEDRDLAVLRVGARLSHTVRLGDSDTVREGDAVALTGYPMALELLRNGIPVYSSTARATVNAVRPARSLVRREPISYIQIDAPVNPGNSGAPLYRIDTGQVVGIVQSKLAIEEGPETGLGFALPINLVRSLLRQARDNPVAAPTGPPPGLPENAIPLSLPASGDDGLATPGQRPAAAPAVTRPFDILPPPQARTIPEPAVAPDGVAPMHAPGGRLLPDPGRPRLYVADFGGNSVAAVDTESGRVLARVFTGSKPYGLAITPDGKTLYVANSGGSEIAILDLETLKVTGIIPLSFRPFDLAAGTDGKVYATSAGSGSASLRAIDVRNEVEIAVGGAPLASGAILAASRDGKTVFAAERRDAPAALFQCRGARALEAVPLPDAGALGSGLQDMALSPDGSRLYVASRSLGYVSVLDAATVRPAGQLDTGTSPAALALSPDGLAAYVCHKDHLDRFDTTTFLRSGTLPLPAPPLHAAVSPDGRKLFIQTAAGVLIRETTAVGPPQPE